MLFFLSLLACFACAICYGLSSVLEKAGADKQKRAKSINPGIMVRLMKNPAYVLGIILDLAVWPLTVFAVKHLPLFVVQPIISLSVIFTVLIERILFKRKFSFGVLSAMVVVLVGLVVIATQAGVETAHPLTQQMLIRLAIIGPLLVLVIGGICARISYAWSTLGLALCAGAAFGMDSVMGRILPITDPLWHILYQPAFIALAAYGLIAVLMFTLALQRTSASIVNAAVIGIETALPAFLGIWLLGDSTRSGSYIPIVVGAGLALVGTIAVTLASATPPPRIKRRSRA